MKRLDPDVLRTVLEADIRRIERKDALEEQCWLPTPTWTERWKREGRTEEEYLEGLPLVRRLDELEKQSTERLRIAAWEAVRNPQASNPES